MRSLDISINEEHMKQVAAELGIEISFGNPPEKCGVLDTTTGVLKSFDEVTSDIFEFLGVSKEEFGEE